MKIVTALKGDCLSWYVYKYSILSHQLSVFNVMGSWRKLFLVCVDLMGSAVASWLEQMMQVWPLTENTALCSWARLLWVLPPTPTGLFQALWQCRPGRLVGSGREKGEAPSLFLPDPARHWSPSSPACFFDRPHWPRAWNIVLTGQKPRTSSSLTESVEQASTNLWLAKSCWITLGSSEKNY